MNESTLKIISAELSDQLIGQKFGKIFPILKLRLAVDFRLRDGNYLFISVEPNSPRIYLIKRKLKELEKQSSGQPSFVSFLRKRLANSVLQNIEKIVSERIIKLFFLARNEIGEEENYTLAVQLTGRSSNLFLLDKNDFILDSLRETHGVGQEIATRYRFPEKSNLQTKDEESFPKGEFQTLSEALDDFYFQKDKQQRFQSIAQSAKGKINKELKKQKRLKKKLNQDLENHGDAEKWKRFGDLLLANLSTAERVGEKVVVIDYFDENTPKVEIEVDVNNSLTEAAEKYFKRYTKARNAKKEISKRLQIVEKEISKLEIKQQKLIQAIEQKDLETIESFIGKRTQQKLKKGKISANTTSVTREFISSDGFEILVGKRSKDNDYLTFRIAKSLDTWLHAADYPGSHVVIRNPNRQEIPKKTLLEAAQLAAFYSKAKDEAKAAVHYTQKKFVNKPKGAAAGLVSLASFKTILVEPKVLEQKN
ncbi:MAG: NFACT family protein [Acidobacteriota bacterium]|nr:NFACT family protein [Acidobacteriota bacterium]